MTRTRSQGGRAPTRRAPAPWPATLALAAGALALAVALAGCESSQERSAQLEKVAKLHAASAPRAAATRLVVGRLSSKVRVAGTVLLHSAEGVAVAVTLHNVSGSTLRELPIAITVKSATGATVYTNQTPGLAPTLLAMPLLAPHATATWIDDQVQAAGTPATVTARVGEGEVAKGRPPSLAVQGVQLSDAASGTAEAEGTLVNRSSASLREVAIYGLALRGGTIVAAGRALVPQVAPWSSSHFQLTFIGDPRGARLQYTPLPVTAPAG